MVRNEHTFDFDTLGELWAEVNEFKPNECLQVRRPGQGKEGPMQEIKDDPQFKDFKTSAADYPSPGQEDDPCCFKICRTPAPPGKSS